MAYTTVKPNINTKTRQLMSGGPEQPNYEAAGIIPYFIENGKMFIYLGFDENDTTYGLWKCFGGGRENKDINSKATALREAKEESCQINNGKCYFDNSIFANSINNNKSICVPKLNTKTSKYYNFYFIQYPKETFIKNNSQLQTTTQNGYKYQFITTEKIQADEVKKIGIFDTNDIVTLHRKFNTNVKLVHNFEPPVADILRDHLQELLTNVKTKTILHNIANIQNKIDNLNTLIKTN